MSERKVSTWVQGTLLSVSLTPRAGTHPLLHPRPPPPSFLTELSFMHSPGLEDPHFNIRSGSQFMQVAFL